MPNKTKRRYVAAAIVFGALTVASGWKSWNTAMDDIDLRAKITQKEKQRDKRCMADAIKCVKAVTVDSKISTCFDEEKQCTSVPVVSDDVRYNKFFMNLGKSEFFLLGAYLFAVITMIPIFALLIYKKFNPKGAKSAQAGESSPT